MLTSDAPRIQPHDLEAEQGVLGAVLLHPSALSRAQEILTAADFYDSRHRLIFEAMSGLAGRSDGIDLVTVGNQLDCAGHLSKVGGRSTLAELLTTVGSSANIESHSRIIRDCAVRRQLIKFASVVSQGAYEKTPASVLLQEAERKLFQISAGRDGRSWCHISQICSETADYVERMSKRIEPFIGIPTGYETLNSMLGGWQHSDLIIVAARPSMGKTAFVLGSVLAATERGFQTGLISLEMSRKPLGLRLHGMGALIDVHALKTGSLDGQGWFQFADIVQRLETLPLSIDDSSVLTVEQIAAKARHLKAMSGLDLLVVDYLQLLHLPQAESRQQGIAEASRKLKLLAKELDIPVIVLSQLSRDCERRPDPRPMLSDLRDSGAIEQDADVVLFLYREEVRTVDTEEKGIAEVLIRKHRNGPIGDRRLRFIDRFAKFEDLPQG